MKARLDGAARVSVNGVCYLPNASCNNMLSVVYYIYSIMLILSRYIIASCTYVCTFFYHYKPRHVYTMLGLILLSSMMGSTLVPAGVNAQCHLPCFVPDNNMLQKGSCLVADSDMLQSDFCFICLAALTCCKWEHSHSNFLQSAKFRNIGANHKVSKSAMPCTPSCIACA